MSLLAKQPLASEIRTQIYGVSKLDYENLSTLRSFTLSHKKQLTNNK
jgi:hypothetical protein